MQVLTVVVNTRHIIWLDEKKEVARSGAERYAFKDVSGGESSHREGDEGTQRLGNSEGKSKNGGSSDVD